jgi:AcrR family transcriptional regulator
MSEIPPSMRERILDAAFTAFMRHGYGGASTAQIARIAQVSKRDLYAHFGSKQAMLAHCVIERAERMRHQLSLPPPTDRAGLSETLVAYGTAVVLELSRPEVLATYRLAILEAENAPDVALTLDRHGRVENTAALIGLLTSARDRGLLVGGEPADMADLFQSMLMRGAMLVRMLMRVVASPTETEARERAEAAVSNLLRLYGVTN